MAKISQRRQELAALRVENKALRSQVRRLKADIKALNEQLAGQPATEQ